MQLAVVWLFFFSFFVIWVAIGGRFQEESARLATRLNSNSVVKKKEKNKKNVWKGPSILLDSLIQDRCDWAILARFFLFLGSLSSGNAGHCRRCPSFLMQIRVCYQINLIFRNVLFLMIDINLELLTYAFIFVVLIELID